MRVTWDEAKRTENLRKHGLDFMDAEDLFEGYTVTLEDDRFDYGEQRFVTFGVWSRFLRWSTPKRMMRSGLSR